MAAPNALERLRPRRRSAGIPIAVLRIEIAEGRGAMGFEAFLGFVSFALAERGPPRLRNAAGFGSASATQSQLLSLARAVATACYR